MLESVVNISEGRDAEVIAAIADAAGENLLDVHSDPDHNRSVLTVVGLEAPRALTGCAVEMLDIATHDGAHPRIGVVDVVPFVPLGRRTFAEAIVARDDFGRWAADELDLPAFVYGPERTLPDVRRGAFGDLSPDFGRDRPHPTAGAVVVGARDVLVAFNLWITEDHDTARAIARDLREPAVRALGLELNGHAQVSLNLLHPTEVGPAEVFDRVNQVASIERAELVGLLPERVLESIDPGRWGELDLARTRTIEARVATRDLDRPV